MKRYALFVTIALFVSLFIVSGASAVIRCVNATPVLGCASYATIQAAVDASVATDIIVVHPGVYYENVVVTGKNNISIQGGKVVMSFGRLSIQATMPEQAVVDARPFFDTCTGPGFYIDAANNISIKNLTVRHACNGGAPPDEGDNIHSSGSYTFIDKVYSLNCDEDGVDIDDPGDHATIQNSVFFGNYDNGVDVTGYALVQNNSIWNNYYEGVYVTGPNSTVTRNDIKTSEEYSDCIHLCTESDGAKVTYNNIQSCAGDGIGSHYSSNQDISNNTIKSVYYNGIYVYGEEFDVANNITIRNNTTNGVGSHGILLENYVSSSLIDRNNISATHDEGIHVDTRPDSFEAANVVSNNFVENVHSAEGINVSDRKPTLTTNTVQNAFRNDCFEVSCGSGDCISGGQISNNKAFYCGEDDDGFRLNDVWYLLISGNIAEHIHDNGFNIDGSYNTIQNNTARWCGANSDAGFEIEGNDNIIYGNLAEFNSQRGFEIYGNNTVTRNTARKNYQTGMWLGGWDDGGTVNVTYNTITDNHGEGLANFAPEGGSSLVNISNNTVLRNRTDICNEGTINTFISNIFTTGGTGTLCDLE
jgi:hypothetical protein